MNENRLTALRALLQEKGLDAVVVTKYVNLHYFSGFRGDDTTLVITKDEALLVTDNRYTEQAEKQAPLFTVVEHRHGLLKKTAELIAKLGCRSVGFEGRSMVYADYRALKDMLTGIDFGTMLDLDALRQVKDEYDVIIIDCQPSLGLLTVNALTAADGVIIPVAAEFFALRGVALLMQSIEKVQSRINPSLEVYGVLVTMYTRTLHCEEVLQRIYEAFQGKVFHSVISRSIKLPDSTVAAAPITIYAPNHKTAKEYREVARELIANDIVA